MVILDGQLFAPDLSSELEKCVLLKSTQYEYLAMASIPLLSLFMSHGKSRYLMEFCQSNVEQLLYAPLMRFLINT